MRLRLMHRPASPVARAIYWGFCLCMLSFILFEVLDIDGSDFPPIPGGMVARVITAEAEHDIRRALLLGQGPLHMDLPLALVQVPAEGIRRLRPARQQACPYGLARPRAFSFLLPRASLPDPSHRS